MHEDDKSTISIPFLSFIQNIIFVHRIKPIAERLEGIILLYSSFHLVIQFYLLALTDNYS